MSEITFWPREGLCATYPSAQGASAAYDRAPRLSDRVLHVAFNNELLSPLDTQGENANTSQCVILWEVNGD